MKPLLTLTLTLISALLSQPGFAQSTNPSGQPTLDDLANRYRWTVQRSNEENFFAATPKFDQSFLWYLVRAGAGDKGAFFNESLYRTTQMVQVIKPYSEVIFSQTVFSPYKTVTPGTFSSFGIPSAQDVPKNMLQTFPIVMPAPTFNYPTTNVSPTTGVVVGQEYKVGNFGDPQVFVSGAVHVHSHVLTPSPNEPTKSVTSFRFGYAQTPQGPLILSGQPKTEIFTASQPAGPNKMEGAVQSTTATLSVYERPTQGNGGRETAYGLKVETVEEGNTFENEEKVVEEKRAEEVKTKNTGKWKFEMTPTFTADGLRQTRITSLNPHLSVERLQAIAKNKSPLDEVTSSLSLNENRGPFRVQALASVQGSLGLAASLRAPLKFSVPLSPFVGMMTSRSTQVVLETTVPSKAQVEALTEKATQLRKRLFLEGKMTIADLYNLKPGESLTWQQQGAETLSYGLSAFGLTVGQSRSGRVDRGFRSLLKANCRDLETQIEKLDSAPVLAGGEFEIQVERIDDSRFYVRRHRIKEDTKSTFASAQVIAISQSCLNRIEQGSAFIFDLKAGPQLARLEQAATEFIFAGDRQIARDAALSLPKSVIAVNNRQTQTASKMRSLMIGIPFINSAFQSGSIQSSDYSTHLPSGEMADVQSASYIQLRTARTFNNTDNVRVGFVASDYVVRGDQGKSDLAAGLTGQIIYSADFSHAKGNSVAYALKNIVEITGFTDVVKSVPAAADEDIGNALVLFRLNLDETATKAILKLHADRSLSSRAEAWTKQYQKSYWKQQRSASQSQIPALCGQSSGWDHTRCEKVLERSASEALKELHELSQQFMGKFENVRNPTAAERAEAARIYAAFGRALLKSPFVLQASLNGVQLLTGSRQASPGLLHVSGEKLNLFETHLGVQNAQFVELKNK